MRRRTTTIAFAVVAVATLATGLTGCRTQRIGARCNTREFAQTATQILQCKSGRWRVLMTKGQYVQLLIALKARSTTTTTPPTPDPPASATTTTTAPAYAVGGGYEHSCAVVAGTVKCIGRNQAGQLGNGTTIDSATAWVSTGITDAVSVSSGVTGSCALRRNGTVWCWGGGDSGRLGNGSESDSSVPVQVTGISTATQISVGASSVCARLSDASARCWGYGTLGSGSSVNHSSTPVTVALTGVASIATGSTHMCAVKLDGTVWCWGTNSMGELGDGTTNASYWPVQVSGIAGATGVAVGGYNASCAVLSSGGVSCWGDDSDHLLGDGDASAGDRLTPNPVVGLTDAVQISMGYYAACARRTDDTVACWGTGGQLGDGTTNDAVEPTQVPLRSGVTTISAGATVTCAVFDDHGASCWGSNYYGQLGSGNTNIVYSPATVLGMP